MNQTYDFVIIGAGPAGLAAALEADKQKLSVLVLDEQPEAGGQIYRSISTTKLLRPETYSLLGPDYQVGHTLEHSFGNPECIIFLEHLYGRWNQIGQFCTYEMVMSGKLEPDDFLLQLVQWSVLFRFQAGHFPV